MWICVWCMQMCSQQCQSLFFTTFLPCLCFWDGFIASNLPCWWNEGLHSGKGSYQNHIRLIALSYTLKNKIAPQRINVATNCLYCRQEALHFISVIIPDNSLGTRVRRGYLVFWQCHSRTQTGRIPPIAAHCEWRYFIISYPEFQGGSIRLVLVPFHGAPCYP